jgi:hypothetical protein
LKMLRLHIVEDRDRVLVVVAATEQDASQR